MPSIEREVGTARTVGAATVDVATFAIPDNSSIHAEVHISGRTAAGLAASARLFFGGERAVSNSRVIGAALVPFQVQDGALIGWLPQVVASGNRLAVRVTGVPGQTISWLADVAYTVNN